MTSPPPSKDSVRHRFRQAIRHSLDVILPSSRPGSPHPVAESAAWNGLETALRVLEKSTDALPPLKSAAAGLLACLDIIQAATTNQKDYQELTSELTTMAATLNRYVTKLGPEDVGSSVARIARSIEAEVEQITKLEGRGTGRRLLGSTQDKEDVTKRYRRIEGLFRELQTDLSLRAWETTDKQFKMLLLERLSPVDESRYNSNYSTTIKRRGCTAETRESVQADLRDWVQDPDGAKVYWMNGMAGTGKTTIAYSLCEWLEANQLLGASFFCSRISSSCRNVSFIVPTIASQLARYSPAFRSALCKVLEEDPNTGKLNVVWQFKKMVQEPMQEVKLTMPECVVVVIDALDECEDIHGVRLVLETLLKLAVNIPLKFFVTSRPEPAIRNKMLLPGGYSPSVLHLHDIEQSIVEGDIKKYLQEALSSMSPPPSQDQFEQLVKLSGKLFIYASTAVRYLFPGDVPVDSAARLKAMLAASSVSGDKPVSIRMYQQLDELYAGILAAAFDRKRLEEEEIDVMRLVLKAVVCAKEPMTAKTLASLLGLRKQQVSLALQPLGSVLHVPESSGPVSTLHASFPDYLFDRMRSGDFSCDRTKHSACLAHCCFDMMEAQLRFNICKLESSAIFDKDLPDMEERVKTCISPALFYACQYWGEHLRQGGASDELWDKLDDFLTQRLLFWMEVLNHKHCVVAGASTLFLIQQWLSTNNAPAGTQKQVADAQAFVARFAAGGCTRSTPHIYISALPFCPRSSSVYLNYWGRARGLVDVKGTAISQREQAPLATWRTDSEIRAAIFASDGTRIVSGSNDGTLRVWDARTGDIVVGPLAGHASKVYSVSFSPDGTRVVSGSRDRTIRVWDARTGESVAGPFEGHTEAVRSVAFSPDGTRVVSGSDDDTILVWDACTGSVTAGPLNGHTYWVASVAFSPNGNHIISGSGDCTIRIWDSRTGDTVASSPTGHTDAIHSVAYSPDGTRIVSGSDDGVVCVWDACTCGVVAGPFNGHTKTVHSVAFSPDSTRIISGSRDCTIRVWDASTGVVLAGPFVGHTNVVWSVSFSPDGTRIVSCSSDRTLRIWDAHTDRTIAGAGRGHINAIHSVLFSPDGTRILSGSHDCTIGLWDAITGVAVAGPFRGHSDVVRSSAFSPDGTRIVSSSRDCTIRVWDARTGNTVVGPLARHGGAVYSVAFDPQGTRIVSGSGDNTIRVWDALTGDTIAGPLQGHKALVGSVAFSPDGTRIASGSNDCTIRTWDARTGTALVGPFKGHAGEIFSVAFSPDGTRIVSGSGDRTVRVWNTRTGAVVAGPFEGHTDEISSVAFSPNGALIVSGSDDYTLRLWNAATGSTVSGPFHGHTHAVHSVSFSPDGTRIVSGSRDNAIRVWELRNSVEPCGEHTNFLQSDAPSPAGTCFVSSSENEIGDALPIAPPLRHPSTTKSTHISDAFTGVEDFTSHNDGWITTGGAPLLWVPLDFHNHLPRPNNTLVIGPQGSAYIDYRDLIIGERWSECYVP